MYKKWDNILYQWKNRISGFILVSLDGIKGIMALSINGYPNVKRVRIDIVGGTQINPGVYEATSVEVEGSLIS